MCLYVRNSTVRNPIHEIESVKLLAWNTSRGWHTPYRYAKLEPGTGWFMPMEPKHRRSEFRTGDEIDGGFIHSYTRERFSFNTDPFFYKGFPDHVMIRTHLPQTPRSDRDYYFLAIARDVVARGSNDIVSKALYLPAFDITGEHRNAIIDYAR